MTEAAGFDRASAAGRDVGTTMPAPASGALGGAAVAATPRPTIQMLFAGRDEASARLPDPVRSQMERSFHADFSTVRVHEGGQAGAIGAHAFTRGEDIHFAPGQYDPQSAAGKELLGHELAHVVQQREGRVAATLQAHGLAINDQPELEHEADELGAKAAQGAPARSSAGAVSTASGAPGVVQGRWILMQGSFVQDGKLPWDEVFVPGVGTFKNVQHYQQYLQYQQLLQYQQYLALLQQQQQLLHPQHGGFGQPQPQQQPAPMQITTPAPSGTGQQPPSKPQPKPQPQPAPMQVTTPAPSVSTSAPPTNTANASSNSATPSYAISSSFNFVDTRSGNPTTYTKSRASIDDPNKFDAQTTAYVNNFVNAGGKNVGTDSSSQVDMAHRTSDKGLRRVVDDNMTLAMNKPNDPALQQHTTKFIQSVWDPSKQTKQQNNKVNAGQNALTDVLTSGQPPSQSQSNAINKMLHVVSTTSQKNLRPGNHITNVKRQEKPDLVTYVSGPNKGGMSPISEEQADMLDEHNRLTGQTHDETDTSDFPIDSTGHRNAKSGYYHSGQKHP